MDPITLLIVCPLVFLAGFVDAIAGGGGLISLPAYLLAGLPAHMALGTNKLSNAIGTSVATLRMARAGYIKLPLAVPAVIGALVGSAIGAKLALLTPEGVFQMLLVVALPVVAILVLRKRDLDNGGIAEAAPTPKLLVIIGICAIVTGLYDGFYGPGAGTFMLLSFVTFAKLRVREASGTMKMCNLASNISALVMFLNAGAVSIALGLIAAAFNVAGNYIGAGLVVKNGSKIVRPLIVVVLCALFAKVLFDLVA